MKTLLRHTKTFSSSMMIAYDEHLCTIRFNRIAKIECKNNCISYCNSMSHYVGNHIKHDNTSFLYVLNYKDIFINNDSLY